jgi:hypothetical protein
VNLNDGCAGGVDLDNGCVVEVHAEEEQGMRCEPQCRGAQVAWTSTTGTRWRCTRRRSEAPAWRRSGRRRGKHGGGAGADVCVAGK